jgi:hypothetical protein
MLKTYRKYLVCIIALGYLLSAHEGRADPFRTALQFLKQAQKEPRRTLINQPQNRDAIDALGEVLERGQVQADLLKRTLNNPHSQPYLSDTLRALRVVDRVPGIDIVLERMASGRGDGNVRGAAFEVMASATLKDRLRAVSVNIDGNEIDGILNDGTIVEMKSYKARHAVSPLAKAQRQLVARCKGESPALLMIKHRPRSEEIALFKQMSSALGNKLTVASVNPRRLESKVVFRSTREKANSPRALIVAADRISPFGPMID